MRYILTGDEISAEEAHRIGLVQTIAPPGEHLQQAIAIADNIAAQAPLGVQASLASCRIARVQGDKAAIARLLPDLIPLMKSEDVKEGVQSFVERRQPRFKGR